MGMFDYVDYSCACPQCGKEIKNFQSKDGDCILANLKFWQVDNFYNSCDYCGTWVEFNLDRSKRQELKIEDYTIRARTS